MGHAAVRNFAKLLGTIFHVGANAPKIEMEAAWENAGNATNNGVKPVAPVVLCGDDARQGVTGHNVRYVLGFGLLGAVLGLAVVAFLA
jgi:hypothetical protein